MTRSIKNKVLILGIGNILMGDEGVGVHVVNSLENRSLPPGVSTLDGGTGSFLLLDRMQESERVILVDATIDGAEPGTVRRLRPLYSKDYPRTLTAHDIGLKDLLDAFYLLGDSPNVTLFAISIPPLREMGLDLSKDLREAIPRAAQMVLDEVTAAA